jgi:hypothetical protein
MFAKHGSVVKLLRTTTLRASQIAKQVGCSSSTVMRINRTEKIRRLYRCNSKCRTDERLARWVQKFFVEPRLECRTDP